MSLVHHVTYACLCSCVVLPCAVSLAYRGCCLSYASCAKAKERWACSSCDLISRWNRPFCQAWSRHVAVVAVALQDAVCFPADARQLQLASVLLLVQACILVLGLDNAGKTTILKKLSDEDITTIMPTQASTLQLCSWNAAASSTRTTQYWSPGSICLAVLKLHRLQQLRLSQSHIGYSGAATAKRSLHQALVADVGTRCSAVTV
jgi:hypothetical protein